jgi:hypothetical protein
VRQAIHEDALQALIETNSAREYQARRGPGGEGWAFYVRLGSHWLPVRSRREPIRVWASPTAIVKFAQGLGVRSLCFEL